MSTKDEALTSSQNSTKPNVVCCFETGVLKHLHLENCAELHIMSSFYDLCADLLKLDRTTNSYWKNKRIIQYRLKKMKDKKLIDWRRSGTGFLGKTDFGTSNLNFYALYDFWNVVHK